VFNEFEDSVVLHPFCLSLYKYPISCRHSSVSNLRIIS